MCDVPTSAEIRQIRQIIPTERLVRWADAAGFDIKKSGGGSSHIVYRHKEFPDIGNSFVTNTKRLGSQYSFADCLLELQKRKIEANKSFSTAAEAAVFAPYKNLPTHLTVEHDFQNGWSVVRDRLLPQIGVTIKFEDARLLENKIRFLEDNKRDAYILLNRHNISLKPAGKNSAERVLSHPVYDIPPVALKPYEAGTPVTSFFEKIGTFVGTVGEKDFDHAQRLSALLGQSFVESVSVTSQSTRGVRQNTLVCRTPSQASIVIEFASHSNQRVRGGNDIMDGRISESALKALESRMNGLAAAHLRAA